MKELFHSRVFHDSKVSRNAYATDEQQINILSKMASKFKSLRAENKPTNLKNGLLISCKSLPNVYNMLRKKYNRSFLWT